MKTLLKTPQKKSTSTLAFSLKRSFAIMSIVATSTLGCQFANAQETPTVISKPVTTDLMVSGTIIGEYGPLSSTNVILKNTRTGTVSDKKGQFKFPKSLKKGDVLVFSYIGYEPQEVIITEVNQDLNITMKIEEFEVVLTASGSDIPYKSKRK